MTQKHLPGGLWAAPPPSPPQQTKQRALCKEPPELLWDPPHPAPLSSGSLLVTQGCTHQRGCSLGLGALLAPPGGGHPRDLLLKGSRKSEIPP